MKHTLLALSLALPLVSFPALGAAEFHVAPNGNDANPGMLQAPFHTVSSGPVMLTVLLGDVEAQCDYYSTVYFSHVKEAAISACRCRFANTSGWKSRIRRTGSSTDTPMFNGKK